MKRGSFEFEATNDGALVDSAENVEALRRLWLDRSLITDRDIGPGNFGDFDHGAWHVACHVVAAGGVRRARSGEVLWLEISHDATRDEYYASVTGKSGGRVGSHRLDSAEGRRMLEGSVLLGFVEGNSVGHISARDASDPRDRFNGWRRQQFDQPADNGSSGGKVWEHWCTVRDIRSSDRIGSSVLTAYIALMAALGDRFVAAVARGRRSYEHPKQLCAMVRAGLTSEEAATWNVTPQPIPTDAEGKLLEARPSDALDACATFSWGNQPRYYMFERQIGSWSTARAVRADLAAFPDQ
jgi:hypothetical protein